MKLSIKLRVTLLCTLLTAAIAALALSLLLAGESRIQKEYYQSSLISAAKLAQNEVYFQDGKLEIDRNLDDLPGVRISLYNPDGDLIYGRHWLDLPFAGDAFRRAPGDSGSEWFVYDTLLEFEAGKSIWLRCICSADAAKGIHSGNERLALLLIPVLVLLAGIGGYGIARQAFRPVSRIVHTAEGIADGKDLKKRISLGGVQDELYALARTFDAMFERLDHAFERERQFTSDVSHELRTPVAAILAQSEFALSDTATDADRIEALEKIHVRAGGMSNLIRRLLTLARMDSGQLSIEPEPLNLGEMAELAAQSFQEAADMRHISIDTGNCRSAEIIGDQTMLMQAALNLIENAIRYSHEGGTVRITTILENSEARLSVEDNGPGIPQEALPHLFKRFYQLDASRQGEGSGLGLSLTDRIARLHNGHILVESMPGKGSCFTLILPQEGDST